MPLTGPNLRAQMADRARTPAPTVAPNPQANAGGQVVVCNLVFQGRVFNPEDLFDALEAKYGAGKVISDTDNVGRQGGPFNLRVLP